MPGLSVNPIREPPRLRSRALPQDREIDGYLSQRFRRDRDVEDQGVLRKGGAVDSDVGNGAQIGAFYAVERDRSEAKNRSRHTWRFNRADPQPERAVGLVVVHHPLLLLPRWRGCRFSMDSQSG